VTLVQLAHKAKLAILVQQARLVQQAQQVILVRQVLQVLKETLLSLIAQRQQTQLKVTLGLTASLEKFMSIMIHTG
jgi:hypothetical protein